MAGGRGGAPGPPQRTRAGTCALRRRYERLTEDLQEAISIINSRRDPKLAAIPDPTIYWKKKGDVRGVWCAHAAKRARWPAVACLAPLEPLLATMAGRTVRGGVGRGGDGAFALRRGASEVPGARTCQCVPLLCGPVRHRSHARSLLPLRHAAGHHHSIPRPQSCPQLWHAPAPPYCYCTHASLCCCKPSSCTKRAVRYS